ncbi:MAG: signal recognition particle-docking protein FtsY [Planctomycetota bacterium]|nr:MAG: signal recognition particle-docking protein FtsY [Planctomycetota bacterium]
MGLFDLFKKGLAKTRDKIVSGLRGVLAFGRKIDEDLLDELHDAMVGGDMGPRAVASMLDEVRSAWKAGEIGEAQEIVPFLKQRIASTWSAGDRALRMASSGPTVIFVVGINGSGKTTSVAKLCHYLRQQGKSVLLGACDTFRAAAIEQLTVWAERTGVDIVKHQTGSDPAAVAFDACDAGLARGADVILIDTAGRLHTQEHLMRELSKIQRVVRKRIPDAPHEVLLVLDATVGQNAIQQAKIFAEAVDVTGLFLAKLDGSARGGIVVGIRDQLDIPVKFVGLGETVEDIQPFDPQTFVEALFADL